MPRFIDEPEDFDVTTGQVYFLQELLSTNTGVATWRIRPRPAQTNVSHAPMLRGWCGETNNVSLTAHGLVKVAAVVKGRLRVEPVAAKDLPEALEALGYPELAP